MNTMKDTTTNPPHRKKTDLAHPELLTTESEAICRIIQGCIQSKKFTFARLILTISCLGKKSRCLSNYLN